MKIFLIEGEMNGKMNLKLETPLKLQIQCSEFWSNFGGGCQLFIFLSHFLIDFEYFCVLSCISAPQLFQYLLDFRGAMAISTRIPRHTLYI